MLVMTIEMLMTTMKIQMMKMKFTCHSYIHKPHFICFCNSFILSQDVQWQMKMMITKKKMKMNLASHVLCICNFLLDWDEDEKMA
jgi:hypothetical protein